jgi:hypothetical protein
MEGKAGRGKAGREVDDGAEVTRGRAGYRLS